MEVMGFLIDLDGVLYVGDRAIDGAREAIGFLSENGYPYRFVSNTTRRCRNTIAERLHRMGFAIDPPRIMTPPLAAVARMRAAGKNRCMLLTTGDVYRDFEDCCNLDPGLDIVDFVVIGDAGDAMTYEALNRAFRLVNAGAGIIALEKDRFWMAPEGLMLSAGPFVTALEYATGKSATVMGKPSPAFFEMALLDMGLPADRVAMIGDDILTDIAGGTAAGMKTILVRTGKYSRKALENAVVKPTAVIDSFADIGELL